MYNQTYIPGQGQKLALVLKLSKDSNIYYYYFFFNTKNVPVPDEIYLAVFSKVLFYVDMAVHPLRNKPDHAQLALMTKPS